MAKKKDTEVWTKQHVESLAPDEASIPAAQKVRTKGGFGTVEPTADGRGWWVVCQGLTDTYQVSVQRAGARFESRCNCPSPKIPCKHVLALLLHLVDHPELRTEREAPKKSTLDFESLVRAAFAHPDDDLHRLVLADYLEENDQPDRAALIRYQCEQARLKPGAARFKELKKLIAATEARVRERLGEFPAAVEFTFRRGFVRLELNSSHLAYLGSLPTRFTNLFRDGWIESLAAYIPTGHYPDAVALLAHVGELDVSASPMGDELFLGVLAETADARANGRLARVKVHSSNRKAFNRVLRAEAGEELDLSAGLDSVRAYNSLNAQMFNQLLRFGRLSGARDLHLGSFNNLGAAEVDTLLTADLSNLRHLRLYGWNLTRVATERLVNSPALAKLTTLSLQACNLQAAVVTALVSSSLFTTLKTLDLSQNNLNKTVVAALMKADVPPKLQRLVLTNYRLDAADRRRLKKKFGTKLKV